MKEIAVNGFTLETDDELISALITKTGVPSLKCKADGKGICKDGFMISLATITKGAFVNSGPMVSSLNATSTKVKADGIFVLRVDDETDTIGGITGVILTNPSGATEIVYFKVKITNAGQSVVKAN